MKKIILILLCSVFLFAVSKGQTTPDGILRPSMFGAKGDSLTNDAAAFNAMFRYLENRAIKGKQRFTVDMEGKKYYIHDQITLPYNLAGGSVYINANGAYFRTDQSITMFYRTYQGPFPASGVSDVGNAFIFWDGGEFVGTQLTGQKCMDVAVLYNSEFKHMHITSFDTAFHAQFALACKFTDNMFTQNKSVAFWGSQAFWSGADVANSSFNANIIENNRIYNYTASPQPYAAIMIYGGNGNFLHQNISEGGGPKYHVILDQQNNSGGLVTTVDGLWVESNGISPSVDLWFNKAQYNTYVKDVHVIYPDTLFKFTNTHGGAQFYFDIPYLGALSSVPFISDGVTLNYGVLISVAPSNSGSASSLFDLLNTSSKWSNGVVFCLMQQLGDLKTDGVHIKSNYPFTINPNSGSPSVNDRPLTIDGTLSFSTDNLASIGGKEGYLNERPKALYLGNHATTDVSGYFGWGDAVSNYDAAHTDLYLYRISSGTLGVYGSNGMSANSYKTFANTSSNQRFTISPGYSNRPNAGIWYENIIANGDTNAIVSLGHNWDNSKTNDGYIRVGLEQKYSPFPGATYRNKEAHLPEVKLTNGTIYRPGSWTGRDDQLSGNWDWRASTYNFFQADVDSLQFGIGNGATVYTPTGGGFYIRHHRMSPSYYGGLYADSVYNYLTLVSTFTNGLQVNSTKTNFTGRIYNNNSYGSDIAIGGDITLEGGQFSANPVNLRFAPSNSLNLAGWKVSTDYMALGINGSSSTFGNDGTRQGIEMLMDTRQGTADPLRIFVHPIGSTQYDALHITNVGKIQFPQYSSSVSGTATYNLSVDASGNVITTSVPLSNSASLNFPSTSAQNSSDLTITVTGAALNDLVVLGVPNGSVNANTCYTAWVSATNTVTVRFNNYSSGAIDPASGTFNVRILK